MRWSPALSVPIAVGVLAAGSLLGGCGQPCTAAGGVTGFSIAVRSPELTDPRFEICLDDDCQTLIPDGGSAPSNEYTVSDSRLNGPAAVDVSVTAVDSGGARLAGGTTTVRLSPLEPNGPRCGTYWRAALTLDGDQLTAG